MRKKTIAECKFQISNCKLQIAAACVFAFVPTLVRAAPFTFDDIEYWVGTGANRAALAIDWVEKSTDQPALVWGYRWDGEATGRDMLLAIVAADDRLFVKLGTTPANPMRVYGLGYDANDDGEFGIEDGTAFDADGIAFGSAPFNGTTSSDSDDFYAEGWEHYFWHYGMEAETPTGTPTNPFDEGSWTDANSGIVGRELENGSWDSWAFEKVPEPPYVFTAYAENPLAAASPYPPGDFNRDTEVDAADYDLWKINFGSTVSPEVDANGNGFVDAADYTIWRDNLATGAGSSVPLAVHAPEPSTFGLAVSSLYVLWHLSALRRKEKFP